MTNRYANYFMQLLFKKLENSRKEEILAIIFEDFEEIFVATAVH
jgi:hypothetical protein